MAEGATGYLAESANKRVSGRFTGFLFTNAQAPPPMTNKRKAEWILRGPAWKEHGRINQYSWDIPPAVPHWMPWIRGRWTHTCLGNKHLLGVTFDLPSRSFQIICEGKHKLLPQLHQGEHKWKQSPLQEERVYCWLFRMARTHEKNNETFSWFSEIFKFFAGNTTRILTAGT